MQLSTAKQPTESRRLLAFPCMDTAVLPTALWGGVGWSGRNTAAKHSGSHVSPPSRRCAATPQQKTTPCRSTYKWKTKGKHLAPSHQHGDSVEILFKSQFCVEIIKELLLYKLYAVRPLTEMITQKVGERHPKRQLLRCFMITRVCMLPTAL